MTNNSAYNLVCGMEIHAELKTASKMFCSCKNDPFFAPTPNSYTCPVCLGMPGGLPVANKKAIEWTIKLGLALNCQINLFSKFDRKHYFYPDLAKGYQISQYDIPFCFDGYIETSEGRVRIRRIHLEEDTGKLQHKSVKGQKVSLIDFNRCGVPLVEIVTEPDIHSPAQAKEYGKKIRQLLKYLEIADCDMEQGGMRLEANISLQEPTVTELPNYKVEVKNINSFRFLEQAISFEVQRQAIELMDGRTPKQETRGWDADHNTTFPQRTKEDAEDYRYFPDPDLPPIHFSQEQIDVWRGELSETPDAVMTKWQTNFQIEPKTAEQLISNVTFTTLVTSYFQLAKNKKLDVNKAAAALINKKITLVADSTPEDMLEQFKALYAKDDVDNEKIASVVENVKKNHSAEFARYQAGETKLKNFLVGQVMRELKAKVDVNLIAALLDK